MAEQFILSLTRKPGLDANSFVVAPCNAQASDFIRRWPDWPASAAALFGPKSCGKTHLASVWQEIAHAVRIGAEEMVSAASDHSVRSQALLIEDLDQTSPDVARDHALMELFDRPRATMLLTGRRPPSQWPAATGDWNSRLQSLVAFQMWSPDDEFLYALVRRHFHERQLQAPSSVIRRILVCVERTPDAVAHFVDSLDRKALSEQRPVSLRLVMEMLGDKGLVESGGHAAPPGHRVVPL